MKNIVLFIILIIIVFWLFVFGGYEKLFPKYTKIGTLSERLTSEPTLVRDLIDSGEKISRLGDYGLSDEHYESEGGYLLRSEVYCSYDISNNVENISEKTGVNFYKGDLALTSLEGFKDHLSQNHAFCVEVLPLDNDQLYGSVRKALSWFVEENGWNIYKKR